MKLTEHVSLPLIKVPLAATDKRAAIVELVDLVAGAGLATNKAQLLEKVFEREAQRTTGIGRGLAIPHSKCEVVDRLVIALGRPVPPIDFEAIDGRPVELIALVASPMRATSAHIQALARLSRLVTNASIWQRILATRTAEELYQVIADTDVET